jgi:transcriptional regulator with XRE-family HTH domain
MDKGRRTKLLKELGNKLRTMREQRDLSLRDLAALADVDHNNINLIEMGQRNPSFITVILLAEALGVPPSDLLPSL